MFSGTAMETAVIVILLIAGPLLLLHRRWTRMQRWRDAKLVISAPGVEPKVEVHRSCRLCERPAFEPPFLRRCEEGFLAYLEERIGAAEKNRLARDWDSDDGYCYDDARFVESKAKGRLAQEEADRLKAEARREVSLGDYFAAGLDEECLKELGREAPSRADVVPLAADAGASS